MFKIIGADGREYGPATAEQVHQWITDDRARANTRARREEETEWKPLSAFPEFAAVFGAPADGQPPKVVPPLPAAGGKSKLAAGLLAIFLGSFGVHNFYLGYTSKAIVQLLMTVLGIFPGVLLCGTGLVAVAIVRIWTFVEGLLILCGSTITTDADGVPLRD